MIDANAIAPFIASFSGRMKFNAAGENPYFTVDMKGIPAKTLLIEEKEIMQRMLRDLCHQEVAGDETTEK